MGLVVLVAAVVCWCSRWACQSKVMHLAAAGVKVCRFAGLSVVAVVFVLVAADVEENPAHGDRPASLAAHDALVCSLVTVRLQ